MIKPILFNTDMVKAILEGRKKVTRRLIKPQPKTDSTVTLFSTFDYADISYDGALKLSPYQPGDILYVRETWAKVKGESRYLYKADKVDFIYKELHSSWKWKPSIHMPKEAARLFLKVKDVCAERLHDSFICSGMPIFNIQDEGIVIPEVCENCIASYDYPCCGDEDDEEGDECGELDDARYEFSKIWDSTIKPKDYDKYGWPANPWVWVIEFERTEKPNEWI